MKDTAVEWLWLNLTDDIIGDLSPQQIHSIYKLVEQAKEQAKAKERSQKAEEYLKGFKDGKDYQIKLDELTFKTEIK